MAWYHCDGKEQDVVVASCVHISRNAAGYPFPARLDAAGARELIRRLDEIWETNGFTKTDFTEISRTSAYALAEQLYVTPAFIRQSLPHALFLNQPCHLSVTVCGEDHIGIQCHPAGLAFRDAYAAVCDAERLLEERMPLAFDPQWGYLTASVNRAGAAMEISAVVFLPLLTEARRIGAVTAHLNRMGMSLRRMYGESGAGYLYRLILSPTPGLTEEDALTRATAATEQIMEAERGLRDGMTGQRRELILDRVKRAEGLLRYAHFLTVEEFLQAWGDVRLGVAVGLIPEISLTTLSEVLIAAFPASLTLTASTPPTDDRELDRWRATTIREKIKY